MPRRRLIIAAVSAIALFGIALLAWNFLTGSPLVLNLVNLKDVPGASAKIVTVRLSNVSDKYIALPGHQRFQVRLDDAWREAEDLPEPSADHLAPKTSTTYCVFAVPARARSCRILLDYRVGPSPYCSAYFFCSRHGLLQRLPTLSRVAINLFPRHAMTRHLIIEMPLAPSHPETAPFLAHR